MDASTGRGGQSFSVLSLSLGLNTPNRCPETTSDVTLYNPSNHAEPTGFSPVPDGLADGFWGDVM